MEEISRYTSGREVFAQAQSDAFSSQPRGSATQSERQRSACFRARAGSGLTNYHKTAVVGYDVTDQISSGENVILVPTLGMVYAGDQGDRFFWLHVRGQHICALVERAHALPRFTCTMMMARARVYHLRP